MELYDKEFVYFDWDDKLEGKKGFFSDNINELKRCVKDNRISFYGEIFKNSDSDSAYPFESIDEADWHRGFKFFYYDPYYEYRKAYLEGRQLQFKNKNGNWEDVWGEPLFKVDEYRIKPEPQHVPFDSVHELIDAWDNKYPQDKNRPEGIMPLIWIKSKEKYRVYLITDFLFEKAYNCDVGTEEENLKLTELFYNFTFADGSIIGKEKE